METGNQSGNTEEKADPILGEIRSLNLCQEEELEQLKKVFLENCSKESGFGFKFLGDE